MTLRSKMRRIVGLEETGANMASSSLPATRPHSAHSDELPPRPIDLGLALDLVERASGEMASVRAHAQAQRDVSSVLAAARKQVAAAGALVSDLQEQLR